MALPVVAGAHEAGNASDSGNAWVAAMLAASALMYAVGVSALWHRAGVGRGVTRAHVVRAALGWGLLAAALLSPLDEIAARSFAAHMVQHELLMVVAAPLLVLSRPLEAFAWALPVRVVRMLRRYGRARPLRRTWRALTSPSGAWFAHAIALWGWHAPVLFVAALASAPLHALQHACFLASALAFWWAVLGAGSRVPGIAAVACLFATMLHTSLLGALITFAPTALYMHVANPFGLTAVEDQQLGGLVMWVPGGLPYLVAGLGIVAAWLADPRARPKSRADDLARGKIYAQFVRTTTAQLASESVNLSDIGAHLRSGTCLALRRTKHSCDVATVRTAMAAKQKPAPPLSKSAKTTQQRSSTPAERGDADLGGSSASVAGDNSARQPVQGQRREAVLLTKRPETSRTRGGDDHRDEIEAENQKAIRKASVRARRLGLH